MVYTTLGATTMKRNIFVKLSFFMMGFGLFVGILFPFIVILLGGSPETTYRFSFIFVSILSGLLVGVVNILIARILIERKISKLSTYMSAVNEKLSSSTTLDDDVDQNLLDCAVCDDSTDKIGESARAFNSLLDTLYLQFDKNRRIQDFSKLMSSNLEIDLISKKALEQLIDNIGAKGGAIAIEDKGDLRLIATYHMINTDQLLKSSIPWETLKNNKRQYIQIPEQVKIDGLVTSYRPTHTLIEPIIYKDISLGIIILSNDTTFDNSDLEYVEVLISILGMAMNNALEHEQLSRLAAKDPLTGLYNRRYGLQRMKEEYSRSLRYKIPLGVAMLDIDHFKKVNDTYGHVVGDKVLSEMALALHDALREGDIAIRYGGEEFLLLLPGAAEKDCNIIAERVRRIVEDLVVTHISQQIKFTVSIGITSSPHCDVSSIEDLISYADKALYTAKENGRNRVIYLFK
jgi:diguanylate cyclase (GGDEF)-like protein